MDVIKSGLNASEDQLRRVLASGNEMSIPAGGWGLGSAPMLGAPVPGRDQSNPMASVTVEPVDWTATIGMPYSRVDGNDIVISSRSCVYGNHIVVRQGSLVIAYLCERLPQWWRITPIGGAQATISVSSPAVLASPNPVSGTSVISSREMGIACSVPVGISSIESSTTFVWETSSSYLAIPGPVVWYPGDVHGSLGKDGSSQGVAGMTQVVDFRTVVPATQTNIGFFLNFQVQAPRETVKSATAAGPCSPFFLWFDTTAASGPGTEVFLGDFRDVVDADGFASFSVFCDNGTDRFGWYFPAGHGGLTPGDETEVVASTVNPYWKVDWEARLCYTWKKVPIGVAGLAAPAGVPPLLLTGQAPSLRLAPGSTS